MFRGFAALCEDISHCDVVSGERSEIDDATRCRINCFFCVGGEVFRRSLTLRCFGDESYRTLVPLCARYSSFDTSRCEECFFFFFFFFEWECFRASLNLFFISGLAENIFKSGIRRLPSAEL